MKISTWGGTRYNHNGWSLGVTLSYLRLLETDPRQLELRLDCGVLSVAIYLEWDYPKLGKRVG